MQFPNFLIIGAMKAGTTTLYHDLLHTPGVYMPPEKEPEDLIHDEVLSEQGRRSYAKRFVAAPHGAICGEASTAYTKAPLINNVPERARAVLGPDLRIVYILRDPIDRIQSEYRHRVGLGLENQSIDFAVQVDESYIRISQYGYQLSKWKEFFPSNQILVIQFEDYLKDRSNQLSVLRNFLGLSGDFLVSPSHFNSSEGKRVVPRGSMIEVVMRSHLYQYSLKPFLSNGIREVIKKIVLPKAREADGALTSSLSHEALTYVIEALIDDPLAGPMVACRVTK